MTHCLLAQLSFLVPQGMLCVRDYKEIIHSLKWYVFEPKWNTKNKIGKTKSLRGTFWVTEAKGGAPSCCGLPEGRQARGKATAARGTPFCQRHQKRLPRSLFVFPNLVFCVLLLFKLIFFYIRGSFHPYFLSLGAKIFFALNKVLNRTEDKKHIDWL